MDVRGINGPDDGLLEELPAAAGSARLHRPAGRSLWVLAALIALAAGLLLARVVMSANAATSGPISWSAPVSADAQGPFELPDTFSSLSCGSDTLCLGTTQNGELITSTKPTSGKASDWSVLPTSLLSSEATGYSLSASSCSGTYCGVTGFDLTTGGSVALTSSNAGGGKSAWNKPAKLPTSVVGIQCPASGECLAWNSSGMILTESGNAWKVSTSPIPASDLVGLSCASPTLCVAVDSGGNVFTNTNPATWLTGSAWTEKATVLGTSSGGVSATSISCPTSTFCAVQGASGSVATTSDPGNAGSASWSAGSQVFNPAYGTTITSPLRCRAKQAAGIFCALGGGYASNEVYNSTDGHAAAFNGVSLGSQAGYVTDVSCPSYGLCIAATNTGQVSNSTDPTDPTAQWGGGVQAAKSGYNRVLLSPTSCPSASLCVGADRLGRIIASSSPNGGAGSWTATTADSGHALSAPVCPSTGLCIATDDAGNVLSSTTPADGGSWSITAPTVDSGSLASLLCPSTTLCVGTDYSGKIITSTQPATASWTSGTPTGANSEILGLNCPSASLCLGVDTSGDVWSSTNPAGGASTWSKTASAIDPHFITDLTCPTSSLCVGYDIDYTKSPVVSHLVTTTHPTGPASAWTVSPSGLGAYQLGGLACPSSTLCVAYDAKGNVLSSATPTVASSWTPTSAPIDSSPLETLNCPSTSLCVATDSAGNAIDTTRPTGDVSAWTTNAVDAGHTLGHATCVGTQLCVLSDDQGNVVPGVGATTPPPTTSSSSSTSTSTTTTTFTPPSTNGKTSQGSSQKASFKKNKLSAKVSCKGVAGGQCKLELKLTTKEKLKGGKVTAVSAAAKKKAKVTTKTVTLASRTVTLAVGKSQTLSLSLNSKGKRLLKTFHKVRALFKVTQLVSGRSPQVVKSQKLTLGSSATKPGGKGKGKKPKKKKKKKH